MGGFSSIIGAAASLMGGSKSQKSTSTTTNEPWKELQPYLLDLYGGAQDLFQGSGGTYPYYPGSTVGDQSPYTNMGQSEIAERLGTAGIYGQGFGPASDVMSSLLAQYNPAQFGFYDMSEGMYGPSSDIPGQFAMGSLIPTAMGEMLNANPYLDEMFDSAASGVADQFRYATSPALQSMFSAAGRYGPNAAMTSQFDLAQQGLGRTLDNLASQIYGGNYASERGLMLNAAQQLGAFGAADTEARLRALSGLQSSSQYDTQNMLALLPTLIGSANVDIDQMLGLGGMQEGYNQRLIDADIARWMYDTQQQNYLPLQQYASLIGAIQTPSSGSTSSSGPGANPLSSLLGGANIGQSIGRQFGGLFGGGATNPTYALSSGLGGMPASYGLNPFSNSGLGLQSGGFDIGGGLGSSLFSF